MVRTDKISDERGKPNNFQKKWATADSKNTNICACISAATQWETTDWKKLQKRVNKLQTRITKATREGKGNLVKKLQYLLTSSFYAKLLAVRKVTTNKGKKTSGVDKRRWTTSGAKFKAALGLKTKGYKAKPLKRIYIEKKGKKKKRPLGIPTMHDRAIQALYAFALDPISEATADKTSFGFRKKRSIMDAAAHIFNYSVRNKGTQWILEGDIKGCFDNINHQWLMGHIPMDKKILNQLLKAGFIYQKQLFPTETGTPQGGILSPIMANITLDGIEKKLKEKYWKAKNGTIHYSHNKNKVNYTRYADDFIVSANSKEVLEDIKTLIAEHLKERGLTLSEEKTLITNLDIGFDFLGWNFRKYKGKLLIKPSKDSLKKITEKVKTIIRGHWGKTQEELIKALNPVITGWVNNHQHVCAKQAYVKLDNSTFHYLWKWAKRRHSNKSSRWIKNRYWKSEGKRNWVFKDKRVTLKSASDKEITRHMMIKLVANPYLPEFRDYYYRREKQ